MLVLRIRQILRNDTILYLVTEKDVSSVQNSVSRICLFLHFDPMWNILVKAFLNVNLNKQSRDEGPRSYDKSRCSTASYAYTGINKQIKILCLIRMHHIYK